ncbi:ATP-dependent DNA helicase PIF1-like [Montipora capricornis]|uniref:ATP-dependent DNA helicase PIF1-like n=1 Tax=Montipora capricornis TaxID=246305 RepID=UPI0035F1C7BC
MANILDFIANISCSGTNPGTQHKKMLGGSRRRNAFLDKKKDTLGPAVTLRQHTCHIDVDTFSDMQRHTCNIVKTHSEQAYPTDPLLLIVLGVAGTGKSCLINAIRNLLQYSCAVTATTGKASYNINGCTIHSLLRGNKDLTGTNLIRLRQNLKGINYIIIDEYSMLGQTMFGWIDRRCRQATGKIAEVFGGKSIILVGDPGQLPPVADKPLYHSSPSSSIENIAEFQYATRLYFSNEEVANYNFHQLAELHQPIARIDARHSSDLAKKASPDQMSGLEPSIFLSKGAKIILTMNLWTNVGLCNGATGTVVYFIYANNQQPPDLTVSIIVKFDDYSGPSINDSMPAYVPICPIKVTSETLDGVHERQQLPLKLAWAITMHKSQGLTLPKAWNDIGHTEKTAGISYVAISRVRTLSTCIIEPMTFERLTSLKRSINLKFRLEEERRLNNLSNFN